MLYIKTSSDDMALDFFTAEAERREEALRPLRFTIFPSFSEEGHVIRVADDGGGATRVFAQGQG